MESNKDKITYKRLIALIILGIIVYTAAINYQAFFKYIKGLYSIISPFILVANCPALKFFLIVIILLKQV